MCYIIRVDQVAKRDHLLTEEHIIPILGKVKPLFCFYKKYHSDVETNIIVSTTNAFTVFCVKLPPFGEELSSQAISDKCQLFAFKIVQIL